MNAAQPLTPAYIESKRAELLSLRDQLQKTSSAEKEEAGGLQQDSIEQAHEYEDDAQKFELLETSRHLVRHDIARLAQINRALRKIDEGTYGYSDISGERISSARLDALPEAVITLHEQQARE
jgi:DnaK suppressor protein